MTPHIEAIASQHSVLVCCTKVNSTILRGRVKRAYSSCQAFKFCIVLRGGGGGWTRRLQNDLGPGSVRRFDGRPTPGRPSSLEECQLGSVGGAVGEERAAHRGQRGGRRRSARSRWRAPSGRNQPGDMPRARSQACSAKSTRFHRLNWGRWLSLPHATPRRSEILPWLETCSAWFQQNQQVCGTAE